jgi:hypothetical protein
VILDDQWLAMLTNFAKHKHYTRRIQFVRIAATMINKNQALADQPLQQLQSLLQASRSTEKIASVLEAHQQLLAEMHESC